MIVLIQLDLLEVSADDSSEGLDLHGFFISAHPSSLHLPSAPVACPLQQQKKKKNEERRRRRMLQTYAQVPRRVFMYSRICLRILYFIFLYVFLSVFVFALS